MAVLLAAAHLYVALGGFGWCATSITMLNKSVAALLQIFGTALILYSIDANLRAFDLHPLMASFREYLHQFPLWEQPTVINTVAGNAIAGGTSSAVGIGRVQKKQSLEDWMKQIEGEIDEIRRHIAMIPRAFKSADDDLRSELVGLIGEGRAATERLERRLQGQARDGVKQQILGALWVLHGAVAGFFA